MNTRVNVGFITGVELTPGLHLISRYPSYTARAFESIRMASLPVSPLIRCLHCLHLVTWPHLTVADPVAVNAPHPYLHEKWDPWCLVQGVLLPWVRSFIILISWLNPFDGYSDLTCFTHTIQMTITWKSSWRWTSSLTADYRLQTAVLYLKKDRSTDQQGSASWQNHICKTRTNARSFPWNV